MALNQALILNALESLINPLDKREFVFGFLDAYGSPKSTIKQLRNGDSKNIAALPSSGEVAFKKGIHFKPVDLGHNIHAAANELKAASTKANGIRFVIVTDWVDVVAYDLKANDRLECLLTALPENYTFFLPLAGFEKATIYSENPADVKAADQMGKLFDLIKERNPPQTPEDIHLLNVFLTRLLFCFFAEDTGIFSQHQLSSAIASYTREDGSDLSQFLANFFEVLNEPDGSGIRQSKPAYLKAFPYVNGGLFKTKILVPDFGAKTRRIMLDCGALQWSEINPDIFGSMFQSVIDEAQRGNLGQHYTSVTNIMKVIQPLFLDKLEAELERSRSSEAKLKALLDRISKIKVFDPACGSGNFLIIAYKELRKIEMGIFKALDEVSKQKVMFMSGIKLSQFYGIEIDDFAHEIALLSLWLTEHQMNQAFRAEFGYTAATLPLKESGNVVRGNSLRLDWNNVCPKNQDNEVYVCGNPPFLGANNRSEEQSTDMDLVFNGFDKHRYLDLVASWFWKGAQYIKASNCELAFVTTNSVCQGVQVEMLWPSILRLGLKIHFAYQSFQWKNSAKDNATVFVSIVGLSSKENLKRRLFSLVDKSWHESTPTNIGPYLIAGGNVVVRSRTKPFGTQPRMIRGNQPTDGGHLLLSPSEKDELIVHEPGANKWIKKVVGADEFMNGKHRFCLWLVGVTEEDLNQMPLVRKRVECVRTARLKSRDVAARKLAERPHEFRDINNFNSFVLIPSVTSSLRSYVPVGFFDEKTISTNLNSIVPDGTAYEAGILMSTVHMDWMRVVSGKLGEGYRYSAQLVYNTFPWPTTNEKQRAIIEKLAEEVILIREDYPDKTLAKLYDPDLMPAPLLAAHQALDAAVEKLYRAKPFKDASERLEHLFARYEKLVANEPYKEPEESGSQAWLI